MGSGLHSFFSLSPVILSFTSYVPSLCRISRRRSSQDIVCIVNFCPIIMPNDFSQSTNCIADLESGRFPEWATKPAPEIAKDYWRLRHDATLLDVIYAVRSDESTHRFVNHSLANLNSKTDVNPFAIREPDMMVKGAKYG